MLEWCTARERRTPSLLPLWEKVSRTKSAAERGISRRVQEPVVLLKQPLIRRFAPPSPTRGEGRGSVADHPGTRGRKTLGAAFGFGHQPRRLLLGRSSSRSRGRARPCIDRASSARARCARWWRCALRLSEGMQKKFGAVRITRGDCISQRGQSCGSSHSAIGRMSVNGPQSLQRYS